MNPEDYFILTLIIILSKLGIYDLLRELNYERNNVPVTKRVGLLLITIQNKFSERIRKDYEKQPTVYRWVHIGSAAVVLVYVTFNFTVYITS